MNELALTGTAWTIMREQASILVKSGFLPRAVDTPEKAVAIMLKGQELGIGAMEALGSINVISGKPSASPQLMLALARRTKELEDLKMEDDGTKCTVTVKRKGQSAITTTFSMDDAKAMGLSGKDNWLKQPKVMRQWRAFAANLRVSFPDAIAGLYTPEELGAEVDASENGEMTITQLPEEPVVTISEPKTGSPYVERLKRAASEILEDYKPDENHIVNEILTGSRSQYGRYSGQKPTTQQAQKLAAVVDAALPDGFTKEDREMWRHKIYKRVGGVEHGMEMDLPILAMMYMRWKDLHEDFKPSPSGKIEINALMQDITKEEQSS